MIAVIMSTYNGEKYLPQQLDSVLRQTLEDFILIIRDDGSSDGTVPLLRGYTDELWRRYARGPQVFVRQATQSTVRVVRKRD